MDSAPTVLVWRFLAGINGYEVLLTLSEVSVGFALHFQAERLWKEAYFLRYRSYRKPANLITRMTKCVSHERTSWRAAVREALCIEQEPVRQGQYSKSDELPPRCSWELSDTLKEPEEIKLLRQIVMEQRTKMRLLEKEGKVVEEHYNLVKRKFDEVERCHSSTRTCLLQSGYGERLPHRAKCQRPTEPKRPETQPRPVGTDPRTRLSLEFVANESNLQLSYEYLNAMKTCTRAYEELAVEENDQLTRANAVSTTRRRPLVEASSEKRLENCPRHSQVKPQFLFKPNIRSSSTASITTSRQSTPVSTPRISARSLLLSKRRVCICS